MIMCPTVVALFHVDRRTEMTRIIFVVRIYVVNALKNLSVQNTGYPNRDSKGTPPEYRKNAKPLEPNFSAHFNIIL
jgi:hypothetical protein